MIIKRKNIVILALVCLLVFVGFLNNKINKMSLLDSSSEYKKHEENLLAENQLSKENKDETINTNSNLSLKEIDDELDIVDSKETQVSNIKDEINEEIEESIKTNSSISNADYFIEYRLSRDKLREGLIERLNEIINNEKTSTDVLKEAQREILKIGDISQSELYLEGLIKAKGFEDALVFLKEDSARIIISVDQLSQQDVMKVLEIVQNETSIPASNITISKKF